MGVHVSADGHGKVEANAMTPTIMDAAEIQELRERFGRRIKPGRETFTIVVLRRVLESHELLRAKLNEVTSGK